MFLVWLCFAVLNDPIIWCWILYLNRTNQLLDKKAEKKQVFREILNKKINFVPTINFVWLLFLSFIRNRHYFLYFSIVLVWCLDAFDSVISSVNHSYFWLLYSIIINLYFIKGIKDLLAVLYREIKHLGIARTLECFSVTSLLFWLFPRALFLD